MATVKLSQAFDFSAAPRNWTIVTKVDSAFATSVIVFESGAYRLHFSGSFTVYPDGRVAGWTSGISLRHEDAEVYRIDLHLTKDVDVFLGPVRNGTYETQLAQLAFDGNDTFDGSSGDDVLMGHAGNDIIRAAAGDDRIDAGEGDDRLQGGAGADRIDGGAGFDEASFEGVLANYKVVRTDTGFTLTSLVDGVVDTVSNVERLTFSDRQIAADVKIDNVGGQVFRLYNAVFDRIPDDAGLRFWMTRAETGTSMTSIAEAFIQSGEYRTRYGAVQDNRELVGKYYEHILDRAPDPSGLDFWTSVLNDKLATNAQVLTAISESQENIEGSAELIANGLVIDLPSWI